MKFRIHLLALPNAQTTRAYSLDGFSQATIRFARMMKDLGHTVILYASEENEAPCDELVTVIRKEEIETLLGVNGTPYQYAYIEAWSPIWQLSNARTIKEIEKRKQPRDLICLIGGGSQKCVADAHPELLTVEYSIGYEGSFSAARVFESSAWMHRTYGVQNITDGRFFDTVIPVFFDPTEFTVRTEKEPFAIFCGRLIPRKGIGIACQAAAAAGVPLKVIGHGDPSLVTHGAEYLGALNATERNDWLSRASVAFCPTQYVEPFNCVAIEAQLSGTPVIATDFGGFVETIEQGKTGYRCSYLGEFVRATTLAPQLDCAYIAARAERRYSMHNLKHNYQRYFERLSLLWGAGWNSL
jgi:glycosyltransferase involved in cell wall biosynthesis